MKSAEPGDHEHQNQEKMPLVSRERHYKQNELNFGVKAIRYHQRGRQLSQKKGETTENNPSLTQFNDTGDEYLNKTGTGKGDVPTTHCYRQAVSSKVAFKHTGILTDNTRSGSIMDEIHPSFQGDVSLPPQFLHREPESLRRSFVIRCPLFSPRI